MKKSPDGIDPVDIYMNGTLNVVTGFALGINYKFDDPDFKTLAKCVKVSLCKHPFLLILAYEFQSFFNNLQIVYVSKFIRMSMPKLWLRCGLY